MRRRFLIPALILGLGLGTLVVLTSPAAEKVDSSQIDKLIDQMGNGDFQEREKATKELQAIGLPALAALKKASQSSDAEVANRARRLLKSMEAQIVSGQVLKPTRLHLVFKDTPLTEAVAEIKKKTGYNINLFDPENKLKDKKITLDTGDVTFWEAFDQFCLKAGLVEATMNDIMKVRIAVPPPGVPVPLPAPLPPGAGGIKPLPLAPALPPDTAPPARKGAVAPVRGKATTAAVAEDKKDAPAPARNAAAPAVAPPPVAPAPPVAVGRPAVGIAIAPGGPMIAMPPMGPGQITLMPGKPRAVPTDARSSFRVRVSPREDVPFQKADKGEIQVPLEVSPEPKIQLQQILEIRIEKAIDDQDQKLKTAEAKPGDGLPVGGGGIGIGGGGIAPAPGVMRPAIAIARPIGFGMGWGGPTFVPVRLVEGAKPAKELKELKGILKAQVLTPAEDAIVVDKILEAKGKTIKGANGGSIKVVDVTKDDNGQIRVRYELQLPPDLMPDNGAGNIGVWGGAIGVPAPMPIRVPPVRRGPALPKGALQAGGKVEIQIGVGGAAAPGGKVVILPGGGPAVGMPMMPSGYQGVTLRDAKNKPLPAGMQINPRFNPDGTVNQEITLFYLPRKGGAEPAKLVFSGRKMATIEVPFALKDVKLP